MFAASDLYDGFKGACASHILMTKFLLRMVMSSIQRPKRSRKGIVEGARTYTISGVYDGVNAHKGNHQSCQAALVCRIQTYQQPSSGRYLGTLLILALTFVFTPLSILFLFLACRFVLLVLLSLLPLQKR